MYKSCGPPPQIWSKHPPSSLSAVFSESACHLFFILYSNLSSRLWLHLWGISEMCYLLFVVVETTITTVQSLSHVWFFETLWTAAHQASLSFTVSLNLLISYSHWLMSIELVMPSSHLILCFPLLLLPSVFPSIRVFSNELALCIRWPKYWNFSFSISPSNEYSGLISFRID